MIIGLNLLYLLPGVVGGTETYARELIRALASRMEGDELVLFVNEECRGEDFLAGGVGRTVVCPVAAVSRRARYAWEQMHLPHVGRRNGVTVLHSLGYVGPIAAGCPHVVTIHDVNFMQRPVRMPWQRRVALGAMSFASAHTADAVVTMSEFSRGEIVRHLRVDRRKITVTHLAARTDLTSRARCGGVRGDVPYIVAFSSGSPHKNIPQLVNAFAQIAGEVPHELRIVGHVPPSSALARAIESTGTYTDRIRVMGYRPEEEMLATLAGAALLAFPSRYEGFGLPIVDAQALGVPVACAAASALPEVAGGAAVLFDPENPADMAAALKRGLSDPELRGRLKELGRTNAARFTWQATAAATADVYRAVAAQGTR